MPAPIKLSHLDPVDIEAIEGCLNIQLELHERLQYYTDEAIAEKMEVPVSIVRAIKRGASKNAAEQLW